MAKMQIFDNEKTTELVVKWQQCPEDHEARELLLDQILAECRKLIESIVSIFDSSHREDLIQEASIRIQYSLTYYRRDVSSLHNYFTTVIRHICYTYLANAKKSEYNNINLDEMELLPDDKVVTDHELSDILEKIITRNRVRFPSIYASDIDNISRYLYEKLTSGSSTNRGIVRDLMEDFDLPRPIATIIYHSTLVYLRIELASYGDLSEVEEPEEFNLLYDLWNIVGDDTYVLLSHYFSGMYVKFPI